jgi:hypothetical protein
MELILMQEQNKNQNSNVFSLMKRNNENFGKVVLPKWFGECPLDYFWFYTNYNKELTDDIKKITKISCYFKDKDGDVYKEENWLPNEINKTTGYYYNFDNHEEKEKFTSVIEDLDKLTKTSLDNSTRYTLVFRNDDGSYDLVMNLNFSNNEFESFNFKTCPQDEWLINKNGSCVKWIDTKTKRNKNNFLLAEEDLNSLIFNLEDAMENPTIDKFNEVIDNFLDDSVFFVDNRTPQERLLEMIFNKGTKLKINHEKLIEIKEKKKERLELLNANLVVE